MQVDQEHRIKIYQNLGDTRAQSSQKIQQVFGGDIMAKNHIKEW